MAQIAMVQGAAQTRTASTAAQARRMAIWLLGVAGLIVAIVVIGGITRLTESGLSITEWKPVSGAMLPHSAAQWQQAFDLYRQTPQFTQVNGPQGMTLGDFKFIFFWEWIHRLLGRVIGLAMALPLAWWWLRRQIPTGYLPRLIALLALIGLQGTFGWLMVRSGLSGRTSVEPAWLATHLLTALFTMAGMIWTALDLFALARNRPRARLTRFAVGALAVLAVQLLYGALMAGLRAGVIASDWPAMQGQLVPAGIDTGRGIGAALVSDPYLVHFIHRWWAVVVVIVLVVLGRKLRSVGARAESMALHSAFGTQFLLGIATVVSGVAIGVAVLHQLVGALLVGAATWSAYRLGQPAELDRHAEHVQ